MSTDLIGQNADFLRTNSRPGDPPPGHGHYSAVHHNPGESPRFSRAGPFPRLSPPHVTVGDTGPETPVGWQLWTGAPLRETKPRD